MTSLIILQYIRKPEIMNVCLQEFLENLDPFPSMSEKEVTDYLWERSIEIEPRNARRPLDGKPKWKVGCGTDI